MVDRTHLQPALFEFVVMADTHYVLPEKANTGEFATRRYQTARIGQALRLADHLDPTFVIHLGDLVQEFPGTTDFPEALRQAAVQLAESGLDIRQAAGNHDVGDKPDPTTAAPWTSREFLDYYHEHVGPSWFSFDEGDVHFVVLNTSIMNNEGLTASAEQWEWLGADLAGSTARRTVVGFHIPPFVMTPDEPSLGHYDNVAEPARSRMLSLFRQHEVDIVFAGHSHFAFVNELDGIRLYVVPSTSTTRPGFCELFSSEAPPEHGHNDADKLGIQVVRVYEDGLRVGFLRTHGSAATRIPDGDGQMLLPGIPADLPTAQLGVTLRHPLANYADVPITFPSAVRQPVRNDYPLLSLVEVGARTVRVPGADLSDARLRERHELLRKHSVDFVGTYLWEPGDEFVEGVAGAKLLGSVEIQIPGADLPSDDALSSVDAIAARTGLPVSICQVTLARTKGVQMHPRQHFGYKPSMLGAVDERLAAAASRTDRVVCHIADRDELWDLAGLLASSSLQHIAAVDVVTEVGLQGLSADAWLAAEAMVALVPFADSRVLVDTLMQLDRTMDVRGGLLDRMCNPRPAFRVLQTLNTVLHGRVVAGSVTETRRTRYGVSAASAAGPLLLVLPGIESSARSDVEVELARFGDRPSIRYELGTGWVRRGPAAASAGHIPTDPTEPFMVLVPTEETKTS